MKICLFSQFTTAKHKRMFIVYGLLIFYWNRWSEKFKGIRDGWNVLCWWCPLFRE